jgi:hypothetical protein
MKKIIGTILTLIALVILYIVWHSSSAVVINDIAFSHKNIDDVFAVEQKIAKNSTSNVVQNKTDVLYNLVLATLQKEILLANNIDFNAENNTQIIENFANFKEISAEIKQELQDEYYTLIIEPVIVNKLFYQVYENFNPAMQNATKILELLQKYQFDSVANAVNIKPVKLNIANSHTELLQTLQQQTGVYNKIIKLENKLIVANILGYDDNYIQTRSFVFEQPSYKDFLVAVLQTNAIKFPFYSLYSMEDIINKEGSVLQ